MQLQVHKFILDVIHRSQETGLPACVRVRVADKLFNLHKHPLCSKSGYFQKRLDETCEVELPDEFPGGSGAFETIALFFYQSSTMIDPFNVAALRCAAEHLEMTEAYSANSLCARLDLYLNQVVLQNWDDAVVVLRKCQTLLPWSEELLIVSRCVESLAFMACMEILDPERRREEPVVTLDVLAAQAWNVDLVKEIVSQDLWMKDLTALPFGFFKRVVRALRRQGMKEKHVCPIIVFYANNWDDKPSNSGLTDDSKASTVLQGILDLLHIGEKASRTVPVGFYLALLSKSLHVGVTVESMMKLQDQIASLLHLAHVRDLLLPGGETEPVATSKELAAMEGIFSAYVSNSITQNLTPSPRNSTVADLWDIYLSWIAPDASMGAERFVQLLETVPVSYRQSHDHLYAAMNSFLQAHETISQEEKAAVCKYLDCQRLSPQVCIEAVQNELMPLRLIVQALFLQQLNTQQAFKDCSESFRYTDGDLSGNLSSSKCPKSESVHPGESPYFEHHQGRTLSFLLQREPARQGQERSRRDYESASFRIQNLEQELLLLKSSIQQQALSKKVETLPVKSQKTVPYRLEQRSQSKRRNPFGQTSGCIYSTTFASQRKCAGKLLKIFQKVTLFGRGKPKTKAKQL
uniref:Phototropic-responsive NPH3 family protein n=1 Tax=Kalanchoe fedtschenkoi TaxID=63787 RepID=A0A7N0VF68_KALFE